MAEDLRLGRIETRLDKISDAIERIARTEERVLSIMSSINKLDVRLASVEADTKELRELAVTNEKNHQSNEWVFKTVFTAVVSALCAAMVLRYF